MTTDLSNTEACHVGAIIQISPTAKVRPVLRGAIVVVDEVRSWGVLGVVNSFFSSHIVHMSDTGLAYVRLPWGAFEMTGGSAVWRMSYAEEKEE